MAAIDLFCGVGGLSAGLRQAGWRDGPRYRPVRAAVQSYDLNFTPGAQLGELSWHSKLPAAHLIVGRPAVPRLLIGRQARAWRRSQFARRGVRPSRCRTSPQRVPIRERRGISHRRQRQVGAGSLGTARTRRLLHPPAQGKRRTLRRSAAPQARDRARRIGLGPWLPAHHAPRSWDAWRSAYRARPATVPLFGGSSARVAERNAPTARPLPLIRPCLSRAARHRHRPHSCIETRPDHEGSARTSMARDLPPPRLP